MKDLDRSTAKSSSWKKSIQAARPKMFTWLNKNFFILFSCSTCAVLLFLTMAGNADAASPIEFGSANYTGEEGSVIIIDVKKPSPDAIDATIDFRISGGTATEGDFIVNTPSTLSWAARDTSPKTITITTVDDAVVEPGETIEITLSNPQSANAEATLGNVMTTTVLIRDNDPSPNAALSVVSGNGQSGRVGSVLNDLVLEVTDGAVSVFGLPVTWSVAPAGAASLQASATTTGTDGRSGNVVTLNQDGIGRVTVTAVAQGVGAVYFVIDTGRGNVPSPVLRTTKISGDLQITTPGNTSEPLIMELIDAVGNPIADNDVNWSVNPQGAGTLASETTTTGSDGRSSNTLTVDVDARGLIGVTAAVVNGPTLQFSIITNYAKIPGLTENEQRIAVALDSTCAALASGTAGLEELAAACSAEGNQFVRAVQQITPGQVASQGNHSIELQHTQLTNITSRLVQLRAGSTGADATELSLDFQGQPSLTRGFTYLLTQSRGGGASADTPNPLERLGVFINGSGSFGDRDGTADEAGFDFSTKGVTAGADYRFTDELIFGGALGYVSNTLDFNSSRGDQDINGYTLSGFGTWYQSERTYVDAILSYSRNNFDMGRRIRFGATDVTAKGETDGREFAASIGGGYDFSRKALSFRPFARVNYISAKIDAYGEKSAGGLELAYDNQDVKSLAILLGGQASYALSTRHGVFSPQVRLEWAHEFEDEQRDITARFLKDPTSGRFEISTDNADRDYFNLGMGVTAVFAEGRSAFIYYETMLGRENLTKHSIAVGLRIEF